ncbi:MAG: D-alanyl-D-alanine carboxypeptidase [Ruminococcus sp.]|nr:D-alanyl-D-alanine carboxypeptidase [Ruminococcus sp.]
MRIDRLRAMVCMTAVTVLLIFSFARIRANAYELPEISAKSAVVYNGRTGEVLYQKNAYERLPMASTTKIMSALIVLEQEDLDQEFVVDSEAIRVEGSSMGLKEGDRVTLRELACGMLLPSGNDAANAAAVRVAGSVEGFVGLMNERAEQLGLKDTHFVTPSGLDDYTDEHYSTAYDMALLTAAAMENEEFREICGQSEIKVSFGDPPFDRYLFNTNKLLKMDSSIVGVKTGFTDKARRCLVSACDREGAELICVTLNAPDDWNDHLMLYDRCFEFISEQRISPENESFELPVAGSGSDRVKCRVESCRAVLLNGRAQEVSCQIYAEPFLYAPVKAGDEVGFAVYCYNGREIGRTAVRAAEDAQMQKPRKHSGIERLWDRIFG